MLNLDSRPLSEIRPSLRKGHFTGPSVTFTFYWFKISVQGLLWMIVVLSDSSFHSAKPVYETPHLWYRQQGKWFMGRERREVSLGGEGGGLREGKE